MTIELAANRMSDSMTNVLYGNPLSGHAWKVRQALVLLNVEHSYAYVDLMAEREDRRPDFLALNPFGEVPVLRLHGDVLVQSNAILLRLARDTGMLAAPNTSTLERWLFWEANRIGFSIPNLRWETKFQAVRREPIISMLRERALADLVFLNNHLEGRKFIAAEWLTMADIACSAYLQFAAEAELELSPYPDVLRWMDQLSGIDGWEHAYDLMDIRRAA